mgnify:CR=1 FL=1
MIYCIIQHTTAARVYTMADWRSFLYCISAVPLGSIEELPGKSCAEIKASEGKAMTYGIHWIYSDENLDQAIQATCEGNSLSFN